MQKFLQIALLSHGLVPDMSTTSTALCSFGGMAKQEINAPPHTFTFNLHPACAAAGLCHPC